VIAVPRRAPGLMAVIAMLIGACGTTGIDGGRKLWIGLFDTPEGLLAVLVGGSIAKWQQALDAAEPVLETVVVPGASPSGMP